MLNEYSTTINQMLLHYDVQELERWRKGDKSLVPEKNINAKGPGLLNGYHYGEFVAERYFKSLGYTVFNNEFNLTSEKSKYHINNKIIKQALGDEKYTKLHEKLKQFEKNKILIKEPDLIVIGPEIFFVEVKRDNDSLKDGQDTFALVVQNLFDIPFKICKVLPLEKEYDISPIKITKSLPSEIMEEYK